MSEDRELLELAAKAAGLPVEFQDEDGPMDVNGWWPCGRSEDGDVEEWWNPLEDDGDALRLAVKLGIVLDPTRGKTFAGTTQYDAVEDHGDDPDAATRRAIVRAAAEIGKQQ